MLDWQCPMRSVCFRNICRWSRTTCIAGAWNQQWQRCVFSNATVLSRSELKSRMHRLHVCIYIYIYIRYIYIYIYIYIYVYTSILVPKAHLYIQSFSTHASSATFHCRWILARRSPAAFSPTSRNQRQKKCKLTWWLSQRRVLRTLQWLDVIWKSFDVFLCRQLWACLADLRWVGNWNLWVMDGFVSMVS